MAIKNICLSSAIIVLMACFVAFAPKLSDGAALKTEAPSVETAETAVARFKRQRAETRDRELAELMTVMTDGEVPEDIRRDAGSLRLDIVRNMEAEFAVEAVLAARGLGDTACVVHNGSASVLVSRNSLSRSQSAIIMESAVSETGLSAGNIKIIPVS